LNGTSAAEGLAALELAIRTAMTNLGGSLLERLLAADSGYRGPRVACGCGQKAEFVAYRTKLVDTVLGPIVLNRAYYHCTTCGHGLAPKDTELGLAGASLSPGLRAMVAHVGAAAPFAKATGLLTELAGVELTTKRVERSAEADGLAIAVATADEAASVVAGKVVPLGPVEPVDRLYIALDGTGVPTVPAETEGRAGKAADGRAHTREVKLGVVFSQTSLDELGRPVRDAHSSTYVATFEPAHSFGALLYAEACRRGVAHARQVIVLGDGAPWIWKLADLHFPSATQVVDFYHAREHLYALGALVAPDLGEDSGAWLNERLAELAHGDIPALLAAARKLALPEAKTIELDKAIGYFATNAERMRYAQFRSLGHFIGSGVVEAGCKSLIGARLKLSGMRWTISGASGSGSREARVSSPVPFPLRPHPTGHRVFL